MTKCKNPSCTKEVVSIEGRRPKEFCSVGCRTKFHNSKNKKEGGKRGRPAGSKNKVRAGIDEFSVDGSVSVVTVYKKDRITPIETPVAIYHSAKEPMLDTKEMADKIASHYSASIRTEPITIPVSNKMPEGLDWKQQLEWKRNNKK